MKALATSIGLALDDRLNPVMVKELRQAVRSRFMVGLLILFLFGQLGVVGVAIIGASDLGADTSAGREVFMAIFAVLNGACMVFVPTYCGLRVASERNESNLDLMFTTSLSPRAIVRGKLLSGCVLSALIYSACTPFMTFTYLLRGIDLPTIFLLLAIAAGLTVWAVQGALFIGSLPVSRFFKGLLGLAAFGGLWSLMGSVVGFSGAGIVFGPGIRMDSWEFWAGLGTWAGFLLFGVWLVFELCGAILAPPSANRALWPRLAVTAGWLLTGGVVWAWASKHTAPEIVYAWATHQVILLSAALIVGVSERESYGPRILRRVPNLRSLRRLAFLFTSGSASGVAWATLLLTCTFTVALAAAPSRVPKPYGGWDDKYLASLAGFALYAYAYTLTGLLLWRWIFKTWFRKNISGAIAVLLCAAVILLPFVVYMVVDPHRLTRFDDMCLVGNPFMVFAGKHLEVHLSFVGAWAILATLLNAPAFAKQWRSFKRLEADAADAGL